MTPSDGRINVRRGGQPSAIPSFIVTCCVLIQVNGGSEPSPNWGTETPVRFSPDVFTEMPSAPQPPDEKDHNPRRWRERVGASQGFDTESLFSSFSFFLLLVFFFGLYLYLCVTTAYLPARFSLLLFAPLFSFLFSLVPAPRVGNTGEAMSCSLGRYGHS